MDVKTLPEAEKELSKLPNTIRLRVVEVFERLERWPNVSGVKWLTGDWKGHARVRTGSYRVVFRLAGPELIEVVKIDHRKDVY